MYVCLPLQTAEQPSGASRGVSNTTYRQTEGVRNSISQRIVHVSLICLPITICPSLWRYITTIGIWDLAAPAKQTTDLFKSFALICLLAYSFASTKSHIDLILDKQCPVMYSVTQSQWRRVSQIQGCCDYYRQPTVMGFTVRLVQTDQIRTSLLTLCLTVKPDLLRIGTVLHFSSSLVRYYHQNQYRWN